MVKQANVLLVTVILGLLGEEVQSEYRFDAKRDPASSAKIQGNGNDLIFKATSVLSTKEHPLTSSVPPMWCLAREADGAIVKPSGGMFWHTDTKTSHVAFLAGHNSNPHSRIQVELRTININETGIYRCDLYIKMKSDRYYASGFLDIKVRPVFHVNYSSSRSYKVSDDDHNKVVGPQIVIRKGETAWIHCPVIANPAAELKWYKDTNDEAGIKAIESNDKVSVAPNGTLTITDASTHHSGNYYCLLENSFPVNGTMTNFNATMVHELLVKGPFEWVIPLIIIAIMAVLLFAIIYGCGIIKRCRSYNVQKREKRHVKTTETHVTSGDARSQEPMLSYNKNEIET